MPSSIVGIPVPGENALVGFSYSRTQDLDVLSWMNFVSPAGRPTSAEASRISAMVRGFKKLGVWNKFDYFYYHAAPVAGLAHTNMVNLSTTALTAYGTFTARKGIKGSSAGSWYYYTHSGPAKMVKDSATMGAWVTDRSGNTQTVDIIAMTSYRYLRCGNRPTNGYSNKGATGDYNEITNGDVGTGLYAVSNDANNGYLFTSPDATVTAGPTGQRYDNVDPAYQMTWCGNSGMAGLAVSFGGSFITPAEMSAINALIKTCLTGNGVI